MKKSHGRFVRTRFFLLQSNFFPNQDVAVWGETLGSSKNSIIFKYQSAVISNSYFYTQINFHVNRIRALPFVKGTTGMSVNTLKTIAPY